MDEDELTPNTQRSEVDDFLPQLHSSYSRTTHQHVTSHFIQFFAFGQDWVVWWQCPACNGWHAEILKSIQGSSPNLIDE
jgi:hypothetical protein